LTWAGEFDPSSPRQIPNEFETSSKLGPLEGDAWPLLYVMCKAAGVTPTSGGGPPVSMRGGAIGFGRMEQQTYPAGTLCWAVMATPDAARTAVFYSGLFGWQTADASAGFASLRLGGREAAGLLQLPEATRMAQASSRWLVYLASDDIGEHLDKVEAAGGVILAPAFDVPGAGRMAVASDPVGAEFGLWEGWGHPGAGVMGEPGSLTWAELYTRSRAAAAGFYSAVFDWAVEEVRVGQETFITCSIDGKPVAGMVHMSAAWQDTPSHWMPYFAVSDVDETAMLADGLGGQTVVAPHDISAGRLAVLRDPLGALLTIIVEQSG
jgi:uncharacterized protein